MTEQDHPIVEVTVAAPYDAVWRALRDPEEIRNWHGWEYDALDEEIAVIYGSGAVASEADGTIDLPEVRTRFSLEDRGDRTVVRVTQSAPAAEAGWEDVYDEVRLGWIAFFQQLRFWLERHPGEERRTVFLGASDGEPLEPAALGLEAAAALPPGERYEATTPWGDRLAGEVWFRGPHQMGLTADALGDGLLVLFTRPQGGGKAILSTYGLPGEELERLRARWLEWWEAAYAG
jgi:hypothetical protein